MRIGKEFGEFVGAVQSSPIQHMGFSKASVSTGAAWYSIWITDECVTTFETLKKALVFAPMIVAPYWDKPFELMSDANVIGALLGKRHDRVMRSPLSSPLPFQLSTNLLCFQTCTHLDCMHYIYFNSFISQLSGEWQLLQFVNNFSLSVLVCMLLFYLLLFHY